MSYENAPATALIATSCICCGRPLLDAVSVEAGIGPDCRAKYGALEAQGTADWDAAEKALAGFVGLSAGFHDAFRTDAQKSANALVHAYAVKADLRLLVAIAALGFARLAEKLTDRAGGIRVAQEGDTLTVPAPYSPAFNEALRTHAPARRWNKDAKAWTLPASARRGLWEALKAGFPAGTPVLGAKGIALL